MSATTGTGRTGPPGPTDAARASARPIKELSGAVGEGEQGDGADHLGRAFKGALAAMRRMRGRESQRPGELSDAQYSLLFSLRERERMSAGELAEAADLRPASVTEMLDGLVNHGLVERTRSDRDRRVVLTSLTERGRALVEERRLRFEPRFRASFAEFTDEELHLAATVLDRFAGFFDELAEERLDRTHPAGGDQPLQ